MPNKKRRKKVKKKHIKAVKKSIKKSVNKLVTDKFVEKAMEQWPGTVAVSFLIGTGANAPRTGSKKAGTKSVRTGLTDPKYIILTGKAEAKKETLLQSETAADVSLAKGLKSLRIRGKAFGPGPGH
jgi:hypothetical protein